MSSSDEWVVLVEHQVPWTSSAIDGTGMQLLFLEQCLVDNGIDVGFEPGRPGETGGNVYSRNFAQPIRMMVRAGDLESAREIAREALAGPEDLG